MADKKPLDEKVRGFKSAGEAFATGFYVMIPVVGQIYYSKHTRMSKVDALVAVTAYQVAAHVTILSSLYDFLTKVSPFYDLLTK